MRTAMRELVRVDDARDLAQRLLSGLPERLAHTVAVARHADDLAGVVEPADRELLVAAAWLHDIGYSAPARESGFHPLDGARYLDRRGWPDRLCGLVAHHSGARFVAAARGLGAQIGGFRDEGSAVTDALAYADQTRGPYGVPTTIELRLIEAVERHGVWSAQAVAHAQRAPYLLGVADRVRRRQSAIPA
jgi:putative nucleotidyltransferase with HDIG domain